MTKSPKLRIFAGILGLAILCNGWASADEPPGFSVMTWNIWHGGREDGETVGPRRVAEIIRDSGADVVAMQETYGSGEQIAEQLGFHFHPRGTNVSILSRFPVAEDLSVFEPFNCAGALIELPGNRQIAFFSIWLSYDRDIWVAGARDSQTADEIKSGCEKSYHQLSIIRDQIADRLSDDKYADIPVVIAGDFNSMSHLDYVEHAVDQYQAIIDWQTSHVLMDQGFQDAWRETNPEVNRDADRTWSPRFVEQEQDRIDFVYYRSHELIANRSFRIDNHQTQFPSDHAAVVTKFLWPARHEKRIDLHVVSYNIRHGLGSDGRLDLPRTASLLGNLRPDIIALQEVDRNVKRSESVDQARFLADHLDMRPVFGKFMDLQGGEYGLAILSRFPVETHRVWQLPDGQEPRIALVAELRLPDDRRIAVINVHFDWVEDDSLRFAQATRLNEFLNTLEIPWVLAGDLNDVPGSRTVALFSRPAERLQKPVSDRFTFSSTSPDREIDYLFASPPDAWQIHTCRPVDAPATSDHRPVLGVLGLRQP